MRRISSALLLAIAVGACASAPSKSDRCAALQRDLDACAGTRLSAIDCTELADGDIERLDTMAQGTGCAYVAAALPLDGDPMSMTCRLLDVGCISATTPAPVRAPTRFPVVLVNGIDTSPLFRYAPRIVDMMTNAGGHRVFLATLPAYEAPRDRAPKLWTRIQEVLKQTGAAKVNLVCHSLGGLDCRYLASPGGLALDLGGGVDPATVVASITTVGTAHHGTRIADVLLGTVPDGDRGAIIDRFASLAGDWFGPEALASDANVRAAIQALSLANAPAFNAAITDAPGVYYQSWAGYSRPYGTASATHDARLRELCATEDGEDGLPGFGHHDYMALPLVAFTDVVGRVDGSSESEPNDGLASVASAKWGAFRGCIPADHMEQLGQRNLPDVNVRTGFDVARFYTNVASDLAARGF